jgi:hypothetical protein
MKLRCTQTSQLQKLRPSAEQLPLLPPGRNASATARPLPLVACARQGTTQARRRRQPAQQRHVSCCNGTAAARAACCQHAPSAARTSRATQQAEAASGEQRVAGAKLWSAAQASNSSFWAQRRMLRIEHAFQCANFSTGRLSKGAWVKAGLASQDWAGRLAGRGRGGCASGIGPNRHPAVPSGARHARA